jgi:WD40 repeat protein/serine/threonine protein kinase
LLAKGLDEPVEPPVVPDVPKTREAPLDGAGSAVQVPSGAVRRFGDYELLDEIARGGMGVVYRARQRRLDRIVAVKMILGGPFASKQIIQRFRGEVAAAALLQHPNIVAIHDVGVHDDQHYFSMDYVEGQNLSQLVGNRPLPSLQAARYVQIIADAIHYAHGQGILHRDLKPSNVLIDSATDQPRITDFGLAKRLNSESSLTDTGQVLGSPSYLSPEQAGGRHSQVGRRSDIYSLGAILYHLLTGRPPFQGETLSDVLNQVINNEPLAPRLLLPGVARDLETICLKCLEKEPSSRYETAQDLRDELGRFLRHEPIEARPASQLEKGWRWCRRKPAIAALSATTFLLLVVLAIGSSIAFFRIKRERERSDQNSYDSDMRLAQFAWDDGDLGLTQNRLRAHLSAVGKPDRRGFEWYYLRNLSQGEQTTILTNHTHAVSCVVFSTNGQRLATSSVGDPVYVWETGSGKLIRSLPEQNVTSLAFAPDDHALGVGSQDQATVWNLETGAKIFEHKAPLGKFQMTFSPVGQLVVLGTNSGLRRFGKDLGNATIWDYVTHQLKGSLPANSGGYLAISPRGDQLVTGNSDQKTKLWDLATLQLIRALETGPLNAMALSPDGRTLATSDRSDRRVRFWETKTGRMIGWLTNYHDQVWSLAFSPDGQLLATGGVDQMVRVWDVQICQQVQQLRGHGSEILALAFSADGETLASGGKDNTVRLWHLHPKQLSTMTTMISNVSSRPVFSSDSRFIAAALEHGGVGVWDTGTLKLRATFANAFDPVAFFPDSNTLIARGTNFFLGTYDIAGNGILQITPGNPVPVEESFAALSPKGKILVLGYPTGAISFFDAKSGVLIKTETNAFAGNIFRMVFSPDGNYLAVAGREIEAGRPGAAKVWDVRTFKMVKWLVAHAEVVLSVDFMPDGKTLVTGGSDNAVRFWDTGTWKEIAPPLIHKEVVNSLAVSPDGKTVAAISNYRAMKLWNPATGRELASFGSGAAYLLFSPDGQNLATWEGNSLRFWRAPLLEINQSRGHAD